MKAEQFKKLGLSKKLLDVIASLGFTKPSEIQEKAIPLALQGKDIIGNSATGSGKTLAFGAGMIEKIKRGEGVQALILAPTRELADQVAKALKKFSRLHNLTIQEVYGGVSIVEQIEGVKKSEIVVGTPGRTLDLLERKELDLFYLTTLVLDEADRMVDMGFLPDVEKIIGNCPIKRQTLLFSATTTTDIKYISKKYMKDPKYVTVESYVDPSKLKQIYYDVQPNMKFSLLAHFLKEKKLGVVMVFCNTRKNVDSIAENLKRYKIDAVAIHGGLNQAKRTNILKQFHSKHIQILICTDVAARGLDIKNVSHVYNYDIPKTSNEYIHRIGRTARAGKEGEAISIVSNRDYENFGAVCMDDQIKIERKETPKIKKLMPHFLAKKSTHFKNKKPFRKPFKRNKFSSHNKIKRKPRKR